MNRLQTYYLIGNLLSSGSKVGQRESIIRALETPTLSWPVFIATGSNHLVLQTIYNKLLEQNLTEYIPSDVLTHLKYIYDLNLKRNTKIIEQVKTINKLLGDKGIVPLYLKGLGNIIDGLYNDIAERIMYDIDFLVQEEQWETAVEILLGDGYQGNKVYDPGKRLKMKHFPTLSKPGSRASVEIHRLPVDYIFSETFGADVVWKNKKFIAGKFNCYVMCDQHKIVHNFIHSQLHHEGNLYAKVFMRNIYDLFLLSKRENVEAVFTNMNHYHRQAANYLQIMNKAFETNNTTQRILGHTGSSYLYRYEINLRTSFISRITQFTLKIFRAYGKLPFLAITDKELRASLIKRLLNKHWYRQHLRSYKRNRLINNHTQS